jgi:hypothetical protein
MGLKDYLARLMGSSPGDEQELSTLSPMQRQYVKGSLDKMLSFGEGGLNHELNSRTLGHEPNYRDSVAVNVTFFYDANTGEMIHFGHHSTLDPDDVFHEGSVRVAGQKNGNKIIEIYTHPHNDGAREVIAETVNQYNRAEL